MAGSRPDPEKALVPAPPAAKLVRSPVDREPRASTARRWRSAELFGPSQEIEIEHGQAVYRLRQTSLGKLILTK